MTDTTTTIPSTDTPAEHDDADTGATDAPRPLFTDFGVEQDLADVLRSRGIVHPFPIQELTLPLGLKGHDLIGQARTGTGKTLGFGLPLIQRIDTSKAQTQALVIVPTRELCIQVADDLTVGAGRGVTSIAVYGGVGYDEQIEALTTGVHVVVGTPGRTLDHLGRGNLDVSNVHTVVLDEADEMLDMGFLPDVERLLVDVPTTRQTLLFSATMPTAIVKLARRFMDKPTFMRADETLHETAPTVDQHFFLVHRMDKPRVLARLLQMPDRGGAFVFCRTKRMCDRLVQELEGLGINAIAVHGDLRQSSRERNLDKFRAGTADVLVATEVAARGLDVSNVSHVVNYDCPDDEKMYLHRIGRTARAGESGVAVTFAEFNEVDRVNVIRKRVDTDRELTEVFSTSDTLTELFDLPETTPWDDLGSTGGSSNGNGRPSSGNRSKGGSSKGGSSKGGSSRGGSSKSGASKGGRSDGGSSRRGSSGHGDSGGSRSDRSSRKATSSGSNRSSGRDEQRAEGNDASRSRGDAGSDGSSRGSSRRRDDGATSSPTRPRTRGRNRSNDDRDANDKGSNARVAKDSNDRGSNDRDTGRSRRDTGDTPTSNDDGQGASPSSEGRGSSRGDGSSSRSSGGRPRARRNRRRGGAKDTSSRGKSSTTSTSKDDSSSGSSGRRDGARSGGRGRGSSNDDRTDSTSSGSTSSGSDRRSSDRSSSGGRSGAGRGNDTTGRRRVTSRGDDARGDGTPRLDRRVDVEHLP